LVAEAPFDLGDFLVDSSKFQEGAHAFYRKISNDVGIKVAKPSAYIKKRFSQEFVILKGIEPSGFTPSVYCHGLVAYIHPFNSKKIMSPYILMQHIEGACPLTILDENVNIYYADSEEFGAQASHRHRQNWAYYHSRFEAHRIQHERIIKVMREQYFLDMCDHEDNLTNFIIQDGLWKVIDFSCETIPKQMRAEMMARAELYLNLDVPSKELQKLLRQNGFLRK
jgi:hypothetical protein